ncbi:MAG: hypothetical protein Q4C63_02305, partial [Eubacteriales bacterium]|nr:hypothetical protein [Eubacteriales bacterium]
RCFFLSCRSRDSPITLSHLPVLVNRFFYFFFRRAVLMFLTGHGDAYSNTVSDLRQAFFYKIFTFFLIRF